MMRWWQVLLINIHQSELEYNQECWATRHFHLVNEIIKRLNVHHEERHDGGGGLSRDSC